WTSGAAGTYILSICGQGTNDSKIAVYNGSGCPGAAAIACNDDACGLQSQLSFAAAASTTYTLQIGKYPASADGAGTFSVSLAPPAPANDSCTTASAIAGAGPHAFDTTAATTGTEGQTENLCLAFASTAIDNDIWYNWTAGSSGLVTLSVCGQSSVDTKVGIYPGTPACPVSGSALACNDDLCGLQSELCWNATSGQTYTIQMGTFPGGTGGTGTFAISVGVCVNPPGVGVTFCEPGIAGVIVCPCGNAPSGPGRGCDNSDATGGAALHSEGIGRLSADTLVFKTAGQRLTGPSLVLQGTTEIANGVTYGDGVRCLGGAIIRLYTRNAVGGQISAPQVGDTPKNISGRSASLGNPIFAGQTRYYMVYYRDAAPSFACPGPGSSLFNTSSAKRIQWIL
ncbi:MAG: hypothetical protein ACKVXR_05055, partial [Planctomycetota bacterium]